MVQGIKALHDKNIIHRDLKSANIFLMRNGICKLGDLNVSKEAKTGLLRTQTGTPYFASPEVWSGKPYGVKSDIWSLGCIFYQMTTLKMPFQGNNFKEVYSNSLNIDEVTWYNSTAEASAALLSGFQPMPRRLRPNGLSSATRTRPATPIMPALPS